MDPVTSSYSGLPVFLSGTVIESMASPKERGYIHILPASGPSTPDTGIFKTISKTASGRNCLFGKALK